MRTILLALALCAAAAPAGAGTIYRWTENGVDHYSDVEHEGAERLRVSDGPNASIRSATREADAPEGNPLQDPKSPEFRQMRCDQKQAQLKQYTTAVRIVEKNNAGVEHEYTPEEREQLLVKTRAEVADYCGESLAEAP